MPIPVEGPQIPRPPTPRPTSILGLLQRAVTRIVQQVAQAVREVVGVAIQQARQAEVDVQPAHSEVADHRVQQSGRNRLSQPKTESVLLPKPSPEMAKRSRDISEFYSYIADLANADEPDPVLTLTYRARRNEPQLIAAVETASPPGLGSEILFAPDQNERTPIAWRLPFKMEQLQMDLENCEIYQQAGDLIGFNAEYLKCLQRNRERYGSDQMPKKNSECLDFPIDSLEQKLCEELRHTQDVVDETFAPIERYYSVSEVLGWISENDALIENTAFQAGIEPNLLKVILASENYWDFDFFSIGEIYLIRMLHSWPPVTVLRPGREPLNFYLPRSGNRSVEIPLLGQTYTPGPGRANARVDSLAEARQYLNQHGIGPDHLWDIAAADWVYLTTNRGAIEAAATYTRYLQELYCGSQGQTCDLTAEDMAVFFEGYRRLENLGPANTEMRLDIEFIYGEEWFFQNYLDRSSLLENEYLRGKYGELLTQYIEKGFGIRANSQLAMPFASYFLSK